MSEFTIPKPTVTNGDDAEVLGTFREGHISQTPSSGSMKAPCKIGPGPPKNDIDNKKYQKDMDKLLQEKEETLNAEFQQRFDREMACLMDRFDFILQNEQIRTSYMLSEAHRERQEKIQALQTQLECKNLAGLMYVMCAERRKSKLEKMRLKEEYSGYVRALQDILYEGQSLILNLSRGYKTAARVDYEWRRKMKNVMKEFQLFVTNFIGGTPEANQFFFDLPTLMKTEAPIIDNPDEDPCDKDDLIGEEDCETDKNKTWWQKLDDDNHPFIVFGDMAEFQPPQRREVLKHVKAAKTAPKKWKEYAFNHMFVDSHCSNANTIKDEYTKHLPIGGKWDCQAEQISDNNQSSKASLATRRTTTASMDVRGNMGSILKIITLASLGHKVTNSALLGARDSMEIVSMTKLREKAKHSDQNKVTIKLGDRRALPDNQTRGLTPKDDTRWNDQSFEISLQTSVYEQCIDEDYSEDDAGEDYDRPQNKKFQSVIGEEESEVPFFDMRSIPNDSLQAIHTHVPDQDHKINYEKVCPMEKCQRMQMKSFAGTLPHYMRGSPFTHFEQTFDEYEACSPEQLAILKQRLEERKKRERVELDKPEESALLEWTSIEGVGVQTSDVMLMPPCTCELNDLKEEASHQHLFNLADLIPVKQIMNKINKEFFFDNNVVFDRFKVIGEESSDNILSKQKCKGTELNDIKVVLKQHPSLLEIFQANTQC